MTKNVEKTTLQSFFWNLFSDPCFRKPCKTIIVRYPKPSHPLNSIPDLDIAKANCSQDINCGGVIDHKCDKDGDFFYLCEKGRIYDTPDGCKNPVSTIIRNYLKYNWRLQWFSMTKICLSVHLSDIWNLRTTNSLYLSFWL